MQAKNRNPRIFISSTFRDMHAERNYLVRYIFPKLNETLRDQNIHVDVVDLRWGVTSDQNAVDACLGLIDESHPFFIGLLGERYGWIPPGQDISITEQEINYAINGKSPRCPHACFYFRETQATQQVTGDTRQDYIEAEDSNSPMLLKQLKEKIEHSPYSAQRYAPRWNDAQQRFERLVRFGEMVYADLLSRIREFYDIESVDGLKPEVYDALLRNSYIAAEASHYILPDEVIYNQLLNFAKNGHPDTQRFWLVGEQGSGKSAMLANLIHELSDDPEVRVISYFAETSSNTPSMDDMMRELHFQFDSLISKQSSMPSKLDDGIQASPPKPTHKSTLIVIDTYEDILSALDIHGEEKNEWDQVWDLLKTQRYLYMIISTRDATLSDVTHYASLNLLPTAVRQQIIGHFLSKYGKRLDDTQMSYLCNKQDAGLPAYLIISLNELRTLGTYEAMTEIIQQLPETLDDLADWIVARIESDPLLRQGVEESGVEWVRRVLSILGLTHMGLSVKEINVLMDQRVPKEQIAILLQLMRPYLRVQNNAYALVNGNVEQAILRRYHDPQSIKAWSNKIANYFMSHLEKKANRVSDVFTNLSDEDKIRLDRMRREAITMLARANRQDELAELKSQVGLGINIEQSIDQTKGSKISFGLGKVADLITEQAVNDNLKQTIIRWHPQPAKHVGYTGFRHDYTPIYKYECCGHSILADESVPPQIISHGCKIMPDHMQQLTVEQLKQANRGFETKGQKQEQMERAKKDANREKHLKQADEQYRQEREQQIVDSWAVARHIQEMNHQATRRSFIQRVFDWLRRK